MFKDVLGLAKEAWDVYLVYEAGAIWDGGQPPAPDCWMHQLSSDPEAPPALKLDPARLQALMLSEGEKSSH